MPRPKSNTSKDVMISFRTRREKKEQWKKKARKAKRNKHPHVKDLTTLIEHRLDTFTP